MNKMDINKLLSWDEVFQFGEPIFNRSLLFNYDFFNKLCNGKYSEQVFGKNYIEYVVKTLQEKFPKLANIIPILDIRFRYQKLDDDKWNMIISPEYFVFSLISLCSGKAAESDKYLEQAIKLANVSDKDKVKEALKESLNIARTWVKQQRDDITVSSNPIYILGGNISNDKQKMKTILNDNFIALNWAYKHVDEIYDELSKPVNYHLFDSIDKDTYFLQLCHFVFYNKSDLLEPGSQEVDATPLLFINNYKLLVDYLSEVNGSKYECRYILHTDLHDGILSSDDIIEYVKITNQANSDNEEYVQFVNKYHTYEELLQDKAKNAWDKIKKERFKKSIECNWDIIPTKEGTGHDTIKSGRTYKSVASKAEYEAKMKKAYDILDSKLDVFSKEECIHQLVGKNGFEGYLGFVYPNDIVIFERFYSVSKRNPSVKKPTINEAIYVMTCDNFEELSQYSKAEILSYIKDFNSKDVMRIYHRGNWQNRVKKIISSSNYDSNDLTMIESITDNIVTQDKAKEKVYE